MPKKKTTRKTAKKLSRRVTKSAKGKSNSRRAPGKTQISISIPSSLVERIDRLADAENRNRSNFIANALAAL